MAHILVYSLNVLQSPNRNSRFFTALTNIFTAVGQLVFRYTAKKLPMRHVGLFVVVASGLVSICWLSLKSSNGLPYYVSFYGLFAGAATSIIPLVGYELFASDAHGILSNYINFAVGIGYFAGTPIAASFMNGATDYFGLIVFNASLWFVASLLLLVRYYSSYGRSHWEEHKKYEQYYVGKYKKRPTDLVEEDGWQSVTFEPPSQTNSQTPLCIDAD